MSREDTHELMIPPEPAHETELAAPRMSASDDQNDNDDVEITPVETEPDVEESPSPKNSPEPVETQPADAGDTGIL